MLILDSKVNVVFQEVEGIVKKFYTSSDSLEELFEEADFYPLPENAPAEIPRFSLKSKGGYSELYFSKNIMQLETKYDGEYKNQWELCAENILRKIDAIYEVLDKITGGRYLFSGIKVSIRYDEVQKNGTQKIKNSILNINSELDLFDIDCKMTYVSEGQYINIALSNIREYEEGEPERDVMKPGIFKGAEDNGIMITIDVNDRYLYNTDADAVSTSESMKKMIQKTGRVLQSIPKLIEKGEMHI